MLKKAKIPDDKDIISRLLEEDLKREIVIPLFEDKDWEVIDVHGRGEIKHRCDLLLKSKAHKEEIYVGVQLKAWNEGKNNINGADYVVNEIRPRAEAALRARWGNDPEQRLWKYYWITSGKISDSGNKAIKEELSVPETTGCRVEVWGIDKLYEELCSEKTLRRVERFKSSQLKKQAELCRSRGEGIVASLWAYRAFRHCLRQSPPDVNCALECVRLAISSVEVDRRRARHYSRVIKEVFSCWEILINSRPGLFAKPAVKLEEVASSKEAKVVLSKVPGFKAQSRSWLLSDFERIFRQLEKMEEYYANGPSGLSTLQVCRLLLRFGFSSDEGNIKNRLDRALVELEGERGRSIDGKCSLCTGTLISCLTLARQDEKSRKAVNWLLRLRSVRYCHLLPSYIDVPSHQHALHYAATAMTGLLDFFGSLQKNIEPVVDVFFSSDEVDHTGFIAEWMRYRNIDRFEVARYIFSAFLRLHLMGETLQSSYEKMLVASIRSLLNELLRDSGDYSEVCSLYSARTNLGSFTLGTLLGVEETYKFTKNVVDVLHRRARRAGENDQLWDSTVDRTIVFIESYLDFWETILYLQQEKDRSLEELLPTVTRARKTPTPPS